MLPYIYIILYIYIIYIYILYIYIYILYYIIYIYILYSIHGSYGSWFDWPLTSWRHAAPCATFLRWVITAPELLGDSSEVLARIAQGHPAVQGMGNHGPQTADLFEPISDLPDFLTKCLVSLVAFMAVAFLMLLFVLVGIKVICCRSRAWWPWEAWTQWANDSFSSAAVKHIWFRINFQCGALDDPTLD